VGAGSLEVEIDLGRPAPAALITGSPKGFSFDGRRLTWRLGVTPRKAVFRVGVMRIADALFRMDDAKEVVRTLSDESYSGYKKDLSRRARRWFMRVARNGIFAKYGYIFRGRLDDFFSALAWYKPNPGYSDDLLTQEDRDMIKFIIEVERDM
jgi:hypothetical protein